MGCRNLLRPRLEVAVRTREINLTSLGGDLPPAQGSLSRCQAPIGRRRSLRSRPCPLPPSARRALNTAFGKKRESLDNRRAPPGVPGHQVELPLHIRIVDLPAKDLDGHEDGRERMTDLVDHFAGAEAGWEGAEGDVRRVEQGHWLKG